MTKLHNDAVKQLESIDRLIGSLISFDDFTDNQKEKLNEILIAVESAKQSIKPVIEGYYGDSGYLAY